MSEKRRGMEKRQKTVPLDGAGIDRLSELLVEALVGAQADRKDILRLRLALEDALALWQPLLPAGTACTFRSGARLGRQFAEVSVPGPRLDPAELDGDGGSLYSGLTAQAGLALTWQYREGVNRLTVCPPRRQRLSPLAWLVLSFGAAAVCGAALLAAPEGVRTAAAGIVDPLFSAMMGVLQALAGPMIFLSVCCGILGIGSVQALGRIGRTVIARFLLGVFAVAALTALCLVWLFRPAGGAAAGGGDAAAQIYAMLLGIVPGNLFAPFLEGNSLQIIFLAVCAGLALLVLGERTAGLAALAGQLNAAVGLMMEAVSRFIPAFTFISLLSLLLSDALTGLGGVAKGLLLVIGACLVCPLLYALLAALRLGVSWPMLLRKELPTYLIALATASSSAALSTNLETCRRRLGISPRIVNFAVPLGQVVFKTGASAGFLLLAFGLAEFYGVAMSPVWVVTGVLVTGMLAVAAPPIPGGSLTCYTVLLTQLGIPEGGIALAIAGNVILDFFMTSCGIACLQSELVLAAHRLGMLDRAILRKE